MASILPETLTRLQATAFVNNAELGAINRDEIIRSSATQLAEQALRKVIRDCIKTEGDYQGYRGSILRLDVYVISPEELHQIIAQARRDGENDAMRWREPFVTDIPTPNELEHKRLFNCV